MKKDIVSQSFSKSASGLFDVDRMEYPRPQIVRQDYAKLSGTWQFSFDTDDKGIDEKWQTPGKQLAGEIEVPFPYQTEKSGINDKTIHNVVWYKREVEVPASWETQNGDKDLMLYFGAVDYHTTVYVNGIAAWTNEGGHVPFSLNIQPYLNKDGAPNEITLRVEDPQDADQPRGKQAINGLSQNIFYYNTTGIWQDVWMEPVPKTRIEGIKLTPNAKTKTVDVEMPISLAQTVAEIDIDIIDNGKVIGSMSVEPSVAGARFKIMFPDDVKLWSPENPQLYDLSIRLKDEEGKTLDEINTYVGLRDIKLKDGRYHLNGNPVFLIGMLDQGYWPDTNIAPPSGEALKRDVEWVKELGCNAVRKHQKMEDPRWLYWTDKLGLMVWGEMANAQTSTPEGERKLSEEWRRAVERDYNHPSIITWVPTNESWGSPDLRTGDKRQYTFLEKLVEITHKLDQTRPMSPNEGWQLTDNTDIVGIHDYAPDADELKGRYTDILNGGPLERAAGTSGQKIMANDAIYRGQPILLTEVGGFLRNPESESGIGYGRAQSEEDLLAKFENLLQGMKDLGFLAGFFYTQFTDVEQEKNGLMTYDRQFIVPVEKIRAVVEKVFSAEAMKNDVENTKTVTAAARNAQITKWTKPPKGPDA